MQKLISLGLILLCVGCAKVEAQRVIPRPKPAEIPLPEFKKEPVVLPVVQPTKIEEPSYQKTYPHFRRRFRR